MPDRIYWIGWLVQTKACKQKGSVVIVFGRPENADLAILKGLICKRCGCTVSKVGGAEAFYGVTIVQAGSFDDVQGLEEANPGAELYVSRRVSWEGRCHPGRIYDSSIRVKQCFNCQQFGHVGTQCRASKRCSCCAGAHDLKGCPRPELSSVQSSNGK
jgi:hypothetical protein